MSNQKHPSSHPAPDVNKQNLQEQARPPAPAPGTGTGNEQAPAAPQIKETK